MTLDQALEKWPDAIQMKIKHQPYWMTKEQLIAVAEKNSSKAVFISIGKTSSRVIFSRKAKESEPQ
jgi:hypothetical protein